MFRLVGAVLLLAGTGGFSVCLCREMRFRLIQLYEMKRMYELFGSQIAYSLADFPELCRMSESYMKPPFSSLLHAVYERAEENTGTACPLIWEEEVERYFPEFGLKKEDKILLLEFARSFGYADRALMEQEIQNRIGALLQVIQDIEKHMAEREKMIVSLGMMGGLLLVILLI